MAKVRLRCVLYTMYNCCRRRVCIYLYREFVCLCVCISFGVESGCCFGFGNYAHVVSVFV